MRQSNSPFLRAGTGKCKLDKSYCQGVSDAFWQTLLNDLTSSGQGFASTSMTDDMITKLNDFFYIFQPKARGVPSLLL